MAVCREASDGRHHVLVTDDTVKVVTMSIGFDFQFNIDKDALHAAPFVPMDADEAFDFQTLDEKCA